MKNLKNKIIAAVIAIISLTIILCLIMNNDSAIKTIKTLNGEEIKTAQETYNSNENTIEEDAIVESISITQRKTGVGPFDEDDEPGNDSSEDNDIVRSFDQVTWTLESTMGIKNNTTGKSYTGGKLNISAKLPNNCNNYAKWDLSSMAWAEDAIVSEDGTTFTAKYSMSQEEVTIPGKQTLVLALKVLGAPNNLEIQPTFTVGIEGNDESTAYSIQDENVIKVSAAPKYNIVLKRNTLLANKTTVDYGNGETTGRMYGYGIMLELYNDSESKGIKGIEYPTGEITFDINTKLERSEFSSTNLEDITSDCTPILWDYQINNKTKEGSIEGRELWGQNLNQYFFSNLPIGVKLEDRTCSVNNSGNLKITQENSKLKVSISNYEIDGEFPVSQYLYDNATRPVVYGENEGIFSVGYFQIFIPDNEASTIEDRNYYLTLEDNNFSATSISGKVVTAQIKEDDDKDSVQHVLYSKGSYNHDIGIRRTPEATQMESTYGSGDATANIGQEFMLCAKFRMSLSNEYDVYSASKFIKFDGAAFEPVLFSNNSKYKKVNFDGNMEFKVWYVTKKDGTNWTSQEEMNNSNIEDMNLYENIEDIPNGNICIGEFIESTGGNLAVSSGSNNAIAINLKVKDTAQIAQTYAMTQRTKLWKEELDRSIYTITNSDVEYPEVEWDSGNRDYIKAEYDENGKMITGTHSGGAVYGNSIFVTGAELKVSRTVSDKASDGTEKVNYDIGKNEYEVTYKILPTITNEYSQSEIAGVNLKITDTLPSGMKYISSSSNYGEPEIINNEDGSSTLVWYIYNCAVNEVIEPILYKAHINEETPNGKQYETKTIISEIKGEGESYKIGNVAEEKRSSTNSIQIINLSSYSLYKTSQTPIIEVNGLAHYKVTFINKTDDIVNDFQLLDILPYNQDNRGTNFDGNYTVQNIVVKQTNTVTQEVLENSNLNLYITESEDVRTGATAKDENLGQGDIWESIESNQTINKTSTGYALTGVLPARDKIEIDIYIKTQDNKPQNIYCNSVSAQTNKETQLIQTPVVSVETIKRELEGNVWLDTNKNGVIDEQEQYLSGITLKLLNEDGTDAIDVDGQKITETVTDEDGYYHFENMVKGKYKVIIKNLDEKYDLTEKEVGSNIEINSKFNQDKTTDVIEQLNTESSALVSAKNINAGLIITTTNLTVHHYIEGTTTKLSEDVKLTGKIGQEYTTSAATDIPSKYELVAEPINKNGILQENNDDVIYYYRVKDASLIVKYLEKNTNEEIATQVTITGKVEEDYQTEEKEIENYQFIEDTGNTTGKLTENPITVIYYYLQKTKVTVNHIDKITGITLENESTNGLVGDEFTSSSKDFENYVLVEKPEIETVNMTKDEIILNYYYTHISAGVIEKHIDIITNEILENKTHEGKEGDSYDIPSKTFEGYDLVTTKLPQNNKGTMTIDPIEVKYYYIKKAEVITEYIDKITGKKLIEDVSQTGHEGDEYTTENKEFENYTLVKIPENAQGTMDAGTTKVTYEYVHKSAGVVERHYDIKTNQLLEQETRYEGKEGDEYTTNTKEFEGYDVVKEKLPLNAKGNMTIEEIEVDYYYIQKTKVIVKYVDKITGNEVEKEETIEGHEGDEYKTESKIIDGYVIIEKEIPSNKEGKMTKEDITVTYYYIRPAEVEVQYIDKTTNRQISTIEQIKGYENDEYVTEQKQVEYYKFVESSNNTKGNMKVEIIEQEDGSKKINNKTIVKYYYEPLNFNLKVDKNITKILVSGEEKKVTNGNLAKLEINRKKIDDTNVKVEYVIKVKNNGEIAGNAILIEKIPQGFLMKQEDNTEWTIQDGIAQADVKDINPGEEKQYTIVLEWIQSETNFGTKENKAYLDKVNNGAGFDEISLGDNEDTATLILSITTGEKEQQMIIVAALFISTLIVSTIILQGKRKIK